MRVRHGLKTVNQIADYIAARLTAYGFALDRDGSTLSDSQYIIINNYTELTGKESPYNVDKFVIRISNHDLPASYEGLHGFYDADLKAESDRRAGTAGIALSYDVFIERFCSGLKTKSATRGGKLPACLDSKKALLATYDKIRALPQSDMRILAITTLSRFTIRYNKSEFKETLAETPQVLRLLEELAGAN